MKKYLSITVFLVFIASTFSFAQVDSSDLMNSIEQVGKQQKRLEKRQKKVQRSNRKLEKQQKRVNRQNRKLNKESKRSNKEMREMERDQKRLEESKIDSTRSTLLYNRKGMIMACDLNTSQKYMLNIIIYDDISPSRKSNVTLNLYQNLPTARILLT
jgi:septal ring factor EnvC (AmiA/AmiB activator)